MYKPDYSYTRSSPNIPHPSLPTPNTRNLPSNFPSTQKLDLRKFNEYLQQKISRKVHKSRIRDTKRAEDQPNTYNQTLLQYERLKNHARLAVEKSSQSLAVQPSRPPSAQKYTSPNNRSENDYINGKVQWKRHESIEKLLEKQNKFTQNSIRKQGMPESQSSSMEMMEQKYQQLQYKYKKLMQETIISNKQFEEHQRQLRALKQQHLHDQQILMQLKSDLMGVQLSKSRHSVAPKTDSKNVQTIKSHQIIESDISITNSQLPQKSWKSKQGERQDRQDLKNSIVYSKGNRTGQSWLSKANTSSVPQFHQPSSKYEQPTLKCRNYQKDEDRKSCRYYSADKMANNSRRSSKGKKVSDVVQYTQIESKTTIKFGESLSSSKVKVPEKLMEHKFEPEKSITPTTLHKKMINSGQYSKYRFQPTMRLN